MANAAPFRERIQRERSAGREPKSHRPRPILDCWAAIARPQSCLGHHTQKYSIFARTFALPFGRKPVTIRRRHAVKLKFLLIAILTLTYASANANSIPRAQSLSIAPDLEPADHDSPLLSDDFTPLGIDARIDSQLTSLRPSATDISPNPAAASTVAVHVPATSTAANRASVIIASIHGIHLIETTALPAR